MPVKRRRSKSRSTELAIQEYIVLVIGDLPDRPEFRTDKARRAAWNAHREEILAESRAGHRPWAWWEYDAPEARDESQAEEDQLIAMGVVDDDERAKIISDRAARPH